MTPAPMVRSRRKAKGAGPERREEILAAALRLFSEHGVSTRQIAAAVGISQPSLYAYFPTKQVLVEEVTRRAFLDLSERMTDALRHHPPGNRLAGLARVYAEFGFTQPDAYRVAFMLEGVSSRDRGNADSGLRAGLGAFAIYRDTVTVALGPEVGEEEVDLVAQSTWASLHGLVSLMIARPTFPWADRARLVDLHVERLFPLRR